MISQIAAAAVGTIAFSLLFSVPRSYYPYCGLIGGVGWLIYCSLEGALSVRIDVVEVDTHSIFLCPVEAILHPL